MATNQTVKKDAALVILAAGIGSRFGNNEIKQLALLGPNNRCIMEYAIYDAISVGFTKVIFIIRPEMEQLFRDQCGDRIAKRVKVEYAYQRLTDLPKGYEVPEGREKPWGTGQALLDCGRLLNEPFIIINADDYYAKDVFEKSYAWLCNQPKRQQGDPLAICSIGFVLGNTLSEQGGVTRGICTVDESGYLTGVDETRNICKLPDGTAAQKTDDVYRPLPLDATVSMNVWAASSDLIPALSKGFEAFLQAGGAQSKTEEFLLPMYIDQMIQNGEAKVQVIPTQSNWFGVTYQADKQIAKDQLAKLVAEGVYPADLWQDIAQ